MDKTAFLEFLSTAKAQGASAQDVSDVIKEAAGEEINPHELEALMASLPQDGHEGHPGADPHAGGPSPEEAGAGGDEHGGVHLSDEQIEQIAQMVLQHIQSQGGEDAGMEGLPSEHQQQLAMAKTSEYIGEFIKRGSEYGLTPDVSVNMYCELLNNSIHTLKTAAAYQKEVEKTASVVDEETLAYFQGIVEKAASENLSYEQTLDLLKKQGADKILKEKFTNIQ